MTLFLEWYNRLKTIIQNFILWNCEFSFHISLKPQKGLDMAGITRLGHLATTAKKRLSRVILQTLGEYLSAQWIIVFQMGKVGSLNIVTSLKKRVGITPVFHVHVLSEKQTTRMQGLIEQKIETQRHTALVEYANRMRRKLTNQSGPRKKIVSLVRDPVSQMIATTMSEFVENNPGVEDQNIKFDAQGLPALHEFFAKRLEYEYDFIAPWFNTEIYNLFGINVLVMPFSRERGYAIFEGRHADLLLIRTEDLNRCSREAFATFLNLEDFELIGVNRAEDKGLNYARAYSEFKKTVALSDELLDKLYSIEWVRYFYSEEEIESFRLRWKNHE